MADLTDLERSEAIRIVGSNEMYAADVKSNMELNTSDSLNGSGLQSELTIGTTSVEGKVGASILTNRKYVIFLALDKGIYFGSTSAVTILTGIPIFKNQLLMVPKGQSQIWFIADGAGKRLRFIEEA